MAIQFDEERLKHLVTDAIFNELTTPESREQLLKDAIASLLKPTRQKTSYGGSEPYDPIENAIAIAVSQTTQQILIEEIKNHPEIKNAVHTIVTKVIDSMLDDDEAVRRITESFTELIVKTIARPYR
ncbi:hypothetical protein [Nostoc sp.]|uniref:hypothetical protein n=1 Tax=Nostoc sp. TaxID=1180 RepID=UPI002FFB2C3E